MTNYVINRGMVHLNDRYIGNTDKVQILGPERMLVRCTDMSRENLDMLLKPPSGEDNTVVFESKPVCGKFPSVKVVGNVTILPFELKPSEEWVSISFEVNGKIEFV